jgi:hypothetical protein
MPDLTTRDVFEQINTRLTRVGDDLLTMMVAIWLK